MASNKFFSTVSFMCLNLRKKNYNNKHVDYKLNLQKWILKIASALISKNIGKSCTGNDVKKKINDLWTPVSSKKKI